MLILGNFYFARMWCLERTDFEHFSLWDGVEVLKEPNLNNFVFGRMWCS